MHDPAVYDRQHRSNLPDGLVRHARGIGVIVAQHDDVSEPARLDRFPTGSCSRTDLGHRGRAIPAGAEPLELETKAAELSGVRPSGDEPALQRDQLGDGGGVGRALHRVPPLDQFLELCLLGHNNEATRALPNSVMQIGPDQGQLMALLVKLVGARMIARVRKE